MDWQARAEKAETQLAGCLAAAEGFKVEVDEKAYGWSVALQKTIELRRAFEKACPDFSPQQILDSNVV